MFDIGWSEVLVIGAVILFAFGPEDIPKIMYNLGRVMRRFRYMRYALSSQFENFMEEAEKSGKIPAAPAPKEITHDDESDADEFLHEMMPIADNQSETPQDDDRSDTNSRGQSRPE